MGVLTDDRGINRKWTPRGKFPRGRERAKNLIPNTLDEQRVGVCNLELAFSLKNVIRKIFSP